MDKLMGGRIPKGNGDVPILCEPGTTYMPKGVIEKYGTKALRAITGNNIVEIPEQTKEIPMAYRTLEEVLNQTYRVAVQADRTLEEVLNQTYRVDNQDIVPDFRVAVQAKRTDGIHIIVHPMNTNGNTLDLLVKGNVISNPFDTSVNQPLDPSEGK